MTFTGTQAYLSPERVREGSNCSTSADIWSLGLTLFEIATGKFPLPQEAMVSIMDLLDYIKSGPSPVLPEGMFSPEFNDFINSTLQKEIPMRASPDSLLSFPFITNMLSNPPDILAWCISMNSNK